MFISPTVLLLLEVCYLVSFFATLFDKYLSNFKNINIQNGTEDVREKGKAIMDVFSQFLRNRGKTTIPEF